MSGDKCVYINCKNTRRNSFCTFHPFPSNLEISKTWMVNSGKYTNNKYIIIYVLYIFIYFSIKIKIYMYNFQIFAFREYCVRSFKSEKIKKKIYLLYSF